MDCITDGKNLVSAKADAPAAVEGGFGRGIPQPSISPCFTFLKLSGRKTLFRKSVGSVAILPIECCRA
jgi:hypothetical protein